MSKQPQCLFSIRDLIAVTVRELRIVARPATYSLRQQSISESAKEGRRRLKKQSASLCLYTSVPSHTEGSIRGGVLFLRGSDYAVHIVVLSSTSYTGDVPVPS
ncbi:hypothetical protein E2C01_030756 [Portunus trituberculatus]|uniref:Uncharacterized protein n=1 Tax=Portunus trituberculatus TaxID=210409 RepID=A0A5B7ESR3_PORTR|nr:hypothetical protein [Portunus trituberculatus]